MCSASVFENTKFFLANFLEPFVDLFAWGILERHPKLRMVMAEAAMTSGAARLHVDLDEYRESLKRRVGGSPAQAWITVDDAGDGIPADELPLALRRCGRDRGSEDSTSLPSDPFDMHA